MYLRFFNFDLPNKFIFRSNEFEDYRIIKITLEN
jgi:hypothetical protein